MSSLKSRFKAFDDRTGRLERAINLIQDGQQPGLLVARREADKYNPQTRPVRTGPDRVAAVNGRFRNKENDTSTRFDIGFYSDSNFDRPGIPSLTLGSTWGTYNYYDVASVHGYGEGGYGVVPYGGRDSTPTDEGSY